MYTRIALILAWAGLAGVTSIAQTQDFNNYQLLQSSGTLPQEVLTPSSQKYKKELEQLAQQDLGKKAQKGRSTFALESNFVLDQMLRSGLVLFNDPVGKYLQEVVDKIKKANPQLTKELRVYTVRSTAVNAFATDRGSIFVTLGLLARLENEAQLAFILCHEIVHAEHAHSLDLFLTVEAIEKDTDRRKALRESTFDRTLVEKNNYSKELEMEADSAGYLLFANTGYKTESLERVYDVLKYSYLPLANTPLSRDFLGSGRIQFPNSYWLDSLNAITGSEEDEDNPQSTHPSLSTRRTMLNAAMAGKDLLTGSNYLVSEPRFNNLKKVARYELPMLHLEDLELPEALYTSYLLLQDDTSFYVRKCLVKGLYLMAKFKESYLWEAEDYIDELEGELQQVYHVLMNMDDREANVLALRHAWDLHQRKPADTEIKAITEDLFAMLTAHVKKLSEFYPVANPYAARDTAGLMMDSVAAAFAADSAAYASNFWRATFAEEVGEPLFIAAFKKGLKAKGYKGGDEDADEKVATAPGGYTKAMRLEDKRNRQSKRLGVNSIVAVNPLYLRLDERFNYEVQYLDSESGQLNYRDMLKQSAASVGLKMKVLDHASLNAKDVNTFNDISLLNSWFVEQNNYEDLTLTQGLNQRKIDSLAKVYKTDYFLWSGVISLREAEKGAVGKLLLSAVYFPVFPIVLADVIIPDYDMLYFSIVYNVKDIERSTISFNYFGRRDSKTLLKAHLYDTMLQIRSR